MSETVVTANDNGRTLTLRVNDTLRVELAENPTTGFVWSAAATDPVVMALAGDTFQAAGSGIGAGGHRVFHFKAQGRGNASITFILARPWALDTPQSRMAFAVAVI